MKLAIFDLDNTLIAGDSDYEWGEFVVRQGLVDVEAYAQQNAQFYDDYCQGNLDIIAYQRFVFAPLVGLPVEALAALHQEFMQTVIYPLALEKASALIESHRQAGHELLVITATNRFVTEPIVRWLGIDNLIATEPEMNAAGQLLGDVVGVPSFQQGKIIRLQHWLNEKNMTASETWFYSDSHNDLPLLQQVNHAIAVDPDDKLRQHAQQQGWQIISLRA